MSVHGVLTESSCRLASEQGEDMRPGSRGKPLLLTPVHNTLNDTVIPECMPGSRVFDD